jgi:pSer/pThr/pTyr-binding forkhead associated (FHA) protein
LEFKNAVAGEWNLYDSDDNKKFDASCGLPGLGPAVELLPKPNSMICILDVTEGPARGRRLWLKADESLQLGRLSTAQFAIPEDPHLSRHHLVFEGTGARFRVRDVGSSNGTFVNNIRVANLELSPGDRVRAGATTIVVSLVPDETELPFVEPQRERTGTVVTRNGLERDTELEQAGLVQAVGVRKVVSAGEKPEDSSTRLMEQGQLFAAASQQAGAPEGRDAVAEHWARWLAAYFEPTSVGRLYQERPTAAGRCDVVRFLESVQPGWNLILLVNCERLPGYLRQLLDDWCQEELAVRVTDVLAVVRYAGSQDMGEFIRGAMGQDAVIIAGAPDPVEWEYLAGSLEVMHSPSLLSSQLMSVGSDLRLRLADRFGVVMFEARGCGPWRLLAGQKLRIPANEG